MSLTRQFLREFRPLFRMLEEPFGRSFGPASLTSFPRTANNPFAVFNDPFFANAGASIPAVDVHEDGNNYVVEAELPGVKKENVELRIGDGGQSLTIEGKTFIRRVRENENEAPKAIEGQVHEGQTQGVAPTEGSEASQAVTQSNASSPTQLSSERSFTGQSSFSRTIWLPRRVDGTNVSARMEDGILTVRVPKAVDSETVKVNIE